MSPTNTFQYPKRQEIIQNTLSKDLFFIMGLPKSGTTWLTNLLNHHPEICCWAEGHLSNMLFPLLEKSLSEYDKKVTLWHEKFQEMGLDQHPPRLTKYDLFHLFVTATGILFAKAAGTSGVKCIGEKTPDNLYRVEQFAFMFPKAKFIHIIRDGRDGAVSGWNMRKNMNETGLKKKFGEMHVYVGNYAQNWAKGVLQGKKFGEKYPDRYHEMRYEDLHAEPLKEARKVFGFLNVSQEEKIVNEAIEKASFKKATEGRDRGEENEKSFFRKGAVGDWRNKLDPKSIDAFQKQAGEVLELLGYEKGLNASPKIAPEI